MKSIFILIAIFICSAVNAQTTITIRKTYNIAKNDSVSIDSIIVLKKVIPSRILRRHVRMTQFYPPINALGHEYHVPQSQRTIVHHYGNYIANNEPLRPDGNR